ncbi:MAG TPA: metal-dependent hydrolase, partial [Bacteroidota bacterium]|nr:metal-dependent hydrolase [Bacteroidota bacterium]
AGNAAAVAVASVLPDIDTGGSRVGRLCPPLTKLLERRFGHRTLTHSLLFLGLLSLVCSVPILMGCEAAACVLFGYASHPLLDTCTPNGVRLFFPFSRLRCVFPFESGAPHRFRIESGSHLDTALGVILWLSCIPALYVAGMGYERFIRLTQHSVESAVRDYEAFSPFAAVRVALRARNGLSGEILEGEFPVAGALDAHTLVIASPDGRLHSVGRDFEAEFTAEYAVCEKGEPVTISVRQVDMTYQALGILGEDSTESYCFGDVATAFDVPVTARAHGFAPVEAAGKRVRLRFARKLDIDAMGLGGVLATSGTVMVRTVLPQGAETLSGPGADTSSGPVRTAAGGMLITCVVNPGERLDVRVSTGGTVKRGDTLARRILPAFYREEAALSEEKLAAARQRYVAALAAADNALAGAIAGAAADSADHAGTIELVQRGFLSAPAARKSELKWEKSRRALERLTASRALLAARGAIEEDRLRLQALELRARASVNALRCALLSPGSGTIALVRREQAGGKERVSFVIRGGPP